LIASVALPPAGGLGVPWQFVQLAFPGDVSSHRAVWPVVKQGGFPNRTSGRTSAISTAIPAMRAMIAAIVNRMRRNRIGGLAVSCARETLRQSRRAKSWSG
jgi:hypothetical protein